jgi:uncharacterized protein (UPF0332 family)
LDAFDSCLRNGRLKQVEPDMEKIAKEVETAVSELSRARACFVDGNYEECIIQSYFSMNRTLRIMMVHAGYRDTNLYSLVAGMDRLYVQTGRMESSLLEILKLAKDQKDLVQEGARCGRKETRLILNGAEESMDHVRDLLQLDDIPALDAQPMETDELEDEE